MEIWDMMINITRAQADKAFRELDYEAFTALCKLLEDFDKIKMAYGKYFAIRNHLKKDEVTKLQVLFDYLATFEEKHLSLTELYEQAEQYRLSQRMCWNTNVDVPRYKGYLECLEDL